MLRKFALLFLLLAITSAAAQARIRIESQQGSILIFVEGEASAARVMVEALRRSDTPLDMKLEFAGAPTEPYHVRLIVSTGSENVWCADSQPPRYMWVYFSTAVALAPDGKFLFTAAGSGNTSRQSIADSARQTIRELRNHLRGLKDNTSKPDADAGVAQKTQTQPGGPPSEPGVYHMLDSGWLRLNESTPTDISNRGVAAALLTGGLSGIKVVQIYRDAESNLKVQERKPTFYVRGFGLADRDARILRLTKKKRHREVQVASVNAFNPKHGHREQDIREVVIERISDRLIKITTASELEPGEYLLQLSRSDFSDGGYEFSVSNKQK
jgi:hypothetical protein